MITNITPVDCETTNRVQYEGFPYRASLVFGTALNCSFFLTFQVTLKPKLYHALEMIKKKVHLQSAYKNKKTKGKHGQPRLQFLLTHSSLECLHLPMLHSAEVDTYETSIVPRDNAVSSMTHELN